LEASLKSSNWRYNVYVDVRNHFNDDVRDS